MEAKSEVPFRLRLASLLCSEGSEGTQAKTERRACALPGTCERGQGPRGPGPRGAKA